MMLLWMDSDTHWHGTVTVGEKLEARNYRVMVTVTASVVQGPGIKLSLANWVTVGRHRRAGGDEEPLLPAAP
jgi:hypothetical protein